MEQQSNHSSLEYLIQLSLTPKLGHVKVKALLDHFGCAEKIYQTPLHEIQQLSGFGKAVIQSIRSRQNFSIAKKIINHAQKNGIAIIPITSSIYPTTLKSMADSPAVLYVKGQFPNGNCKYIGVVGTRQATRYGKNVTKQLMADLQTEQVASVSGLAYGIDITAHRASIKNQIPTIAVIAGGHDFIYPQVHEKEAKQIIEQGGCLVTEYPYFEKPHPKHFPCRNRIIVGLSQAIIIVEAAKRGGALITAAIADSYGRPVFAVPGGIDRHTSQGCNHLISKMKAQIFLSKKQLFEQLGWAQEKQEHIALEKLQQLKLQLSDAELVIVQHLEKQQDPLNIDNLKWRLNDQIIGFSEVLLMLEIKGITTILPGNKICLSMRINGL